VDPFADIDLDSESVWLDGAWYTRQDLARRIKEMIETGDFRVSRPSQALERLEAALAQARVVTVRMPADLADTISATASRLGRPIGHLVREAGGRVRGRAGRARPRGAGRPGRPGRGRRPREEGPLTAPG
jgi:hypothetical protein